MITQRKSSRSFSKMFVTRVVMATFFLMGLSLFTNSAETIITAGFTMIASLFGIYAGVGHMDLRKTVDLEPVESERSDA